MSACPISDNTAVTDYSAPASFTLTPPAPTLMCAPQTTSIINDRSDPVVTTSCCVGPAGPQGPVGTTTAGLQWKHNWAASIAYKKDDVVYDTTNKNSWVCQQDHTSTADNEPGETTGGDFYWERMGDVAAGTAGTPEQKSWLSNMMDGVYDWVKDMPNWGVGDWITAIAAGAGIIWAGSAIYDMFTHNGTGDGNADKRYNGSPGYNGTFTEPTLPTVVSTLCDLAGLASYDVSLLPTMAVDFTIASTASVRSILEQMSFVYKFDMIDTNGTLKFVPKERTIVKTLTLDDMGYAIDDVSQAPYTAKRMQGIDLPKQVTLNYYSSSFDYNTFAQVSEFQTYPQGQNVSFNVPFTLDDTYAKQLTEFSLVGAHVERMNYSFTTTYEQLELEPGDPISTPMGDLRVLNIEETDEGLLSFVACNTVTSFDPANLSVALPPSTGNVVTEIGYSDTIFLDLPPLDANDSTPRMYMGVHGYGKAAWPGAVIYSSTDNGASYNMLTSASNSCSFGLVASAIVTAPNWNVWDNTTVITVQMKTGALQSMSDLAVQNGANRCMVGQEMIHFGTATLTAPGTYQLTHLLRGRQGTEIYCGSHQNNELFIMIDSNLVKLPLAITDRNKQRLYKTVTIGSDITTVAAASVGPLFTNMTPWKVANVTAVLQPDISWSINWIERCKYDNQLKDYAEIPHDPDHAGWTVVIYNPVDNAIKRTAVVQTPYWSYTEADQLTDFGVAQSHIKVNVIQMSSLVGGGYSNIINT